MVIRVMENQRSRLREMEIMVWAEFFSDQKRLSELRHKRSEGVSCTNMRGRSIPDREYSKCKGPETRVSLLKETSVS